MNANELANEIQQISNRTVNLSDKVVIAHAGLKLRQQQSEIESFKSHPAELTDEEINKLWEESYEDGIAMQQGFTTQQHYFAYLILRKANEK